MTTRILVIEDDAPSRELLTLLFERAGWRVSAADNGEAGLDLAARERPDVIVCDLQMPGIDGFEVARRLRADTGARRVPLIACSAYTMRGDREKALAAGFDAFFAKPIRPESFVQDVTRLLPASPRDE